MTASRSTDYSAVKDDLLHQAPEEISAMFGRVAARYDVMNHVMGGGLDLYWRWRLVRAVSAQKPARVLDLATGSGDVLIALQKRRDSIPYAIGAVFRLAPAAVSAVSPFHPSGSAPFFPSFQRLPSFFSLSSILSPHPPKSKLHAGSLPAAHLRLGTRQQSGDKAKSSSRDM